MRQEPLDSLHGRGRRIEQRAADFVAELEKFTAKFSVYEMARKTWYLGAWINHSGWYPDFQRRLYDRDEARFSGIIHESVRFVGPPGRLNGDLLHYTVRSFEEHQAKVEKYTQLAAQQCIGKANATGDRQ